MWAILDHNGIRIFSSDQKWIQVVMASLLGVIQQENQLMRQNVTTHGKRCLTYCNCILFTYLMLCLIYERILSHSLTYFMVRKQGSTTATNVSIRDCVVWRYTTCTKVWVLNKGLCHYKLSWLLNCIISVWTIITAITLLPDKTCSTRWCSATFNYTIMYITHWSLYELLCIWSHTTTRQMGQTRNEEDKTLITYKTS